MINAWPYLSYIIVSGVGYVRFSQFIGLFGFLTLNVATRMKPSPSASNSLKKKNIKLIKNILWPSKALF